MNATYRQERANPARQASWAQEVTKAIRHLQEEPKRKRPRGITVLRTMPAYRYRYTCPRCECHVVSKLTISGDYDRPHVVCVNCEHVYAARQPWKNRLPSWPWRGRSRAPQRARGSGPFYSCAWNSSPVRSFPSTIFSGAHGNRGSL